MQIENIELTEEELQSVAGGADISVDILANYGADHDFESTKDISVR